MPALEGFHENRFPLDISLGAVGGPTRRTDIVSLVSGHEKRNSKWVHSKRKYNAGFGVKTIDDLQDVVAFFEEQRGRLFGFRFRDPSDYKSCKPSQSPSFSDQLIGTGDGVSTVFQLRKLYGSQSSGYLRLIRKPVDGSAQIAIDNTLQVDGVDYLLDLTTGLITFQPGSVPQTGVQISAGYEFDVPVRFETDEISINLSAFEAGDIPAIYLIEINT